MILYELRCGAGHGFEAWFRNSDTYDLQQAERQITCPVCGGGDVSKAPMAPRIGRSGRRGPDVERPSQEIAVPDPAPSPPAEAPTRHFTAEDHEKMRVVMGKIAELNKHIASTCDYVGKSFADEARKIHYGEAPGRGIYGEASPDEAAELRDEGIAVASLPWLRRTDS
jgi:hypothetical protein